MKKIKHKILLTFLLTFLVFIVFTNGYNIFGLLQSNKSSITDVRKTLYNDYDKMIKGEVETSTSLLTMYYDEYVAGNLTEDEAKTQAKTAIKKLRYSTEGYFWIDDLNGILIAHPIIPEKEGTNRIEIKDPKGVFLIKEVITAAKDNKNLGYIDFQWEKPDDVGTGKLSAKRAYSKLFTPWNWVVSTGNYVDTIDAIVSTKQVELTSDLKNNIIAIGIFSVILLIAVGILGLRLSKKISEPIVKIMRAFEKDENGQISIQEIKLKSSNEIGSLATTLNEMSLQVRSFISGVIKESKNVSNSANTVEADMSLLNNQIQEISQATEQISAGMEETAASTQEMNATATEIVTSVESIASKSQEASISVVEISKRASTLKSDFILAVNDGNSILNDVKSKLDNAIEESKSVTQINELADAILQITQQTNLLALNASIEAARAGEAGKGFSVVASEIKKLAEDSNSNVSRIQSIIKTVTNSVSNLSDNSSKLLEFMSTNVKDNYTIMLNASDDYENDAKNLEVLVSDFKGTAEELHISILNIMKAIDEVTSSSNEGSEGASTISERLMLVTEESESLLLQSNISNQYSQNLISLVSKFKM